MSRTTPTIAAGRARRGRCSPTEPPGDRGGDGQHGGEQRPERSLNPRSTATPRARGQNRDARSRTRAGAVQVRRSRPCRRRPGGGGRCRSRARRARRRRRPTTADPQQVLLGVAADHQQPEVHPHDLPPAGDEHEPQPAVDRATPPSAPATIVTAVSTRLRNRLRRSQTRAAVSDRVIAPPGPAAG